MARKGRNRKPKKGKHHNLTERIAQCLVMKPYCGYIATNQEYSRGELDVLLKTPGHDVYYEIKSRDSQKAYNKAMEQLMRWTGLMRSYAPDKNFYGVYVTPTYMRLAVKNGRPRH